ncbi:LpqN/LpqT family lipoprotein [Cellulosimicrobium cellulans]|uniref:LpqN/LpqT family lipoprotein n=1 Tax=Cellulosimicrobium cellulans TaxID=1710 RepID=UPI0008483B48|nr:LpqN/LpqT family lipoprotein [Cellulosimicrobium cellulans]
MHRAARHRVTTTLTAATVLLAASACGSSDEAPAPAGPVTYDVPSVPVSVTAPAGWERSTQNGAFFIRSADPYGTPAVRPNVVVTAEAGTGTLEEAGADTVAYLEDLVGWEDDPEGQGPTTLGDVPAYRVSGTFAAAGARVAQEIVLVEAAGEGEEWVVHLTASYAADDAEGAAEAREALASVHVTPRG